MITATAPPPEHGQMVSVRSRNWMTTFPPASATAFAPGAARPPASIPAWFRVKCPNPACGEVHSAQASWAGKKGKCPDSGLRAV